MSTSLVAAGPPPPRPLYFVNGPVDFLFVGGLSILAFAGMSQFAARERIPELYSLAIVLLWVANFPHFAASTFRLYESPEHIRQYPLTALVVPWFILAGTVAAFISPDLVAPYWVKLFLIWSSYHFSGQTLGVSLIYARRARFRIERWERLPLSCFIYGTFISQIIGGEIGETPRSYFGIDAPRFGLPDWKLPGHEEFFLVELANVLMYGGAIAFVILMGYRWIWRGERAPWILFVPALAQYVWFVPGPLWMSFYEFVPFFHSLQYLFIAWAVRLKGTLDRDRLTPSIAYVLRESLRWCTLIFEGGVLLFYVLPYVGYELSGLPLDAAAGIVTASVQIHHFFVDGVIWKLRTKSVSSPLMVNLDDLIHTPASVPAPA